MKNKSIFRVFAISLFIVVCSFVFFVYMGYLDEIQVKNVVNKYFSALSEGRYELAKTYCVLNGGYYKLVNSEKKQHREEPLYNPTYTPHIYKYYSGISSNFVDVEIVVTSSNLFGIDVRNTATAMIFLVKEKSGLFGTWKLK